MSFAILSQAIPVGHVPVATTFARRRAGGGPSEPFFGYLERDTVHYYRTDAMGIWVEVNRSVPFVSTTLVSLMFAEYTDDSSIPNAYALVGTSDKEIFENEVNSLTPTPPGPITPTPFVYVTWTTGFPWSMDYHTLNTLWGVGEASVGLSNYTAFAPGTGTSVQSFVAHSDWITGMQYSTNLNYDLMCTCSLDTTSKVYAKSGFWTFAYLHNMVPIYSPPKPHPPCEALEHVIVTSLGQYIVIGCDNGDIQMFEPHTGLFLGTFNVGSKINGITAKWITGTGDIIAAAACDDGLYFVNMDTLVLVQQVVVLQAGIPVRCNSCDWNWDDTKIVSGWFDLTVRVHDTP